MIGHLSIEWVPHVPWPLLAALAGLAAALAAFALWRRAPGVWLRALAMAILLLALANPTLIEEDREALSDVALLVVDRSPSQTIADRSSQTERAVDGLLKRLEDLPDLETRVVEAGADALTGKQEGTQLFAAVREALASLPRGRVGGLLIVSDGQIHDVPEALDQLGLDAPVHLLMTGSEDEGDRRLTVTRAPSFGIVGRSMTLTFRVDDLPEGGGGTAQVTMRQDGGEARVITVPIGREHEAEFELVRRGPSVIELEVEPGPRELTELNNRVAIEVNGVRDRLRVLLVSGEPHSGERAWRNILKSDPAVDLVHFTILRPPEKQDGTPIRELSLIAFPTRELFEVKLDEFDLIIFDRYRRRGVLPSIYLDNIARYVEEGGALLEAVGPTFATPLSLYRTPLGRVLPGEPSGFVYEQGFRPAVTEIGERHPVTAELSGAGGADGAPTWGRWFRQVDVDAASGVIVMNGIEQRPLLILDRVGEGRVAQVLSDHMWLWSRGFEGGGPQADLLRRVAHWLMKEPDLEEEDLRAQVEGNTLEVVRRSLSPEHPRIEVTRPDGEVEEITLEPGKAGRASGRLPVEQSGLYRINDGQRSTLAAVGPLNPLEFTDLRSTAEPLASLTEASQGGVARVGESRLPELRKVKPGRDRHGRGWLGVQANGAYLVTGISQVPVLPAILVLLLALGTAVAAWLREGR
jgi:phosphoglycolate phosphatase-like HAD superfamily hydrolase